MCGPPGRFVVPVIAGELAAEGGRGGVQLLAKAAMARLRRGADRASSRTRSADPDHSMSAEGRKPSRTRLGYGLRRLFPSRGAGPFAPPGPARRSTLGSCLPRQSGSF